jgi:putative peptidoglycan lipid II flippase
MVNNLISKSKQLLNKEHKSILSAAAIIALSYLGSALLGLIRNRLLAATFFGEKAGDLDVFFAALVIPDSLFQLIVAGSISAAFIPVYQSYLKKGKEEANLMANATLFSLGLIFSTIILITSIFALPISKLTANFPDSQMILMVNLLRLMLVSQLILSLSAFLTGVLQSHRRFLVPAIAPLLYNLGIIIGIIFLKDRFGIYSAVWGMILGSLLHALIQISPSKMAGFIIRPTLPLSHKGVMKIIGLMPPRSAALGLNQIERFISINIASSFVAGSVTIFNFARQLYILPITLFGVALGQASFPSLSEEINNNASGKFKSTLSHSLNQIFFFTLPASAILLVLRIPLVRIVFGVSDFPWAATLTTGKTLAIFAISIAPQAASHLLTRAFHAQKDTKTPLIISIISLASFTILSLLFTHTLNFQVVGLAAAMSISNFLSFFLLHIQTSRLWGPISSFKKIIKLILITIATGVFLWLPMRLLDQFIFDTTYTLPLVILTIIASIIGGSVYLFLCFIFNVEELKDVASLINKLGNWRQILGKSQEVIEPSTTQE